MGHHREEPAQGERSSAPDRQFDDLYRENSEDELTVVRPRRAVLGDAVMSSPPLAHATTGAQGTDKRDAEGKGLGAGVGAQQKPDRMLPAIGFTVLSTVLPGLGLLGSSKRRVRFIGLAIAGTFLTLAAYIGFRAFSNPKGFITFVVRPDQLKVITPTLVALGLVWVALIAVAHIVTRPRSLGTGRRAAGALVVTLCSLLIASPLAVAARYAFDQTLVLETVFPEQDQVTASMRPTITNEANPWENVPRLNILLVGADSNAARLEQNPDEYKIGALRTDTMMVASIDTRSGATTIIQIPRNLRFAPFPSGSEMAALYPDGFEAGTGHENDDWLTELWGKANNEDYPDIKPIFADNTYPGAELLKQAMQGITGLKVDYFVLLNTDGLQQLISAMGGVTVNINEPLPKGKATSCDDPSRCLQPGPDQHLNGYDAMWYARSRKASDDYSRMARQSCLVDAIIKQANPGTMITSYEAIAKASSDMVVTDIPGGVLPALLDLALHVKDASIERLVFAPGKNGYSYTHPDFAKMRQAVAEAIAPAAQPSSTVTAPAPGPSRTTTPSPSASATTGQGRQMIGDACAYHG